MKLPPSQLQRSFSLIAGMLLMLGVGSTYALSAWNAQLKVLLHFTQAGISMVSSMTMLGTYMSYLPGVIFDRLGPSTSLLLSGGIMLLIHLVLFTALHLAPECASPVNIGCAMMLFGFLSSFCVFSSIVANESLWGASNRGKVMAALMSAYSCGGAFFTFVFHEGFQSSDVPGYFLFVGIYLFVVCVFGWFVFARQNCEEKEIYSEIGLCRSETELREHFYAIPNCEKLDGITGVILLMDIRFWMLFVPVMNVVGVGLFVMSNVSFIVESLGGRVQQIPFMVALFSVANTLGRLLAGSISDFYRMWYPRAYFAGISALLTAVTQMAFLSVPSNWLVLPVALAGFSEGVMFGIFPVIIREEFGLHDFGKNFGLLSIANCVGYPLFFGPLASYVYQHSAGVRVVDGVEKCFGAQCFAHIFVVASVLSALSLACCAKLARIQRHQMPYNFHQIQ